MSAPHPLVVAPTSDVVPRALVVELLAHVRRVSRSLPVDSQAERQLRGLLERAHRAGIGEPIAAPDDGRVRVLVVLPPVEALTEVLRVAVFGALEVDHRDAAELLRAGRQLHELLYAGG